MSTREQTKTLPASVLARLAADSNAALEARGELSPETAARTRELPNWVLARWTAEDWNDETMTASHYTYADGDGNPIELSEEEIGQYSWGNCEDNITGGSQGGWLRDLEAK